MDGVRGGNRSWILLLLLAAVGVLAVHVRGCHRSEREVRNPAIPRDPSLILVTGYCNCGQCCGWRRTWFGLGDPVYDYGPMKGKPKQVGITASGTRARQGTIAADPQVFPMGTRLKVPGYGEGKVEDVGGAIEGRHIDIWFPSHRQAVQWGQRWLKVERLPSFRQAD